MDFQWIIDIQGALSFRVVLEYLELYEVLEGVVLQPETPDKAPLENFLLWTVLYQVSI